MEREVLEAVRDALSQVFPEALENGPPIEIEIPREKGHGDLATTAAMNLARPLRKPPRAIAEALLPALRARTELFAAVEIAGPGFLNFRLAPARLRQHLAMMLAGSDTWGRSNAGDGMPVMVEFVSANPTGPLNVVNARAAAFGGALTRMLEAAGYKACAEFYVNDVGRQIDLLGLSVIARYRELRGEAGVEFPAEGYQGQYIRDLARDLDRDTMEAILAEPEEAVRTGRASALAVERMCASQKQDLESYGTVFDRWFQQHELYPDAVQRALELLQERGHVESRDGALWFKSSEFEDDQDRVLVRATGEPTYFLADLAYHTHKYDRGIRRSIDIWGPDHHGYIGRMQAGMQALGFGADWLEVLIVQQVNLLSEGQQVKMSKRRGEFITLEDLIEEVGKDTARFFFLQRRAESHLDFDLDLAKKQSDENPVFYVKYAHARISGILRKAEEEGVSRKDAPELDRLEHDAELELMKVVLRFPGLVASAARLREPHRLTSYLREVAQAFHLFYHHCRVVSEDADLTRARLALCDAARLTLANGLALMDIEAPERM